MNKSITNQIIASFNGLEMKDGTTMGGMCKGFHTAIRFAGSRYIINISGKPKDEADLVEFRRFFLKVQADNKGLEKIQYLDGRVEVVGVVPNLKKNVAPRIINIVNQVTDFMNQYLFTDCCGICSGNENVSLCEVNGNPVYMCDACFQEVGKALEENKQQIKQRKGNMVTGIVGALLGSLIGVVVWVIIGQMGYIAGIAGLVIAVCALKGYELFGGKLNIVGIIVCVAILIGMVYFAHMVSTAIIIKNELGYSSISYFDVYKKIGYLLDSYEQFRVAFYKDLVVGYLLTAVASVSTIINIYRSNSGSFHLKKHN